MGRAAYNDRPSWYGNGGEGGSAVLQRIDPRGRIVVALAFSTVMVSLTSFAALGAGLALAVSAMVLARLPMGLTLRRMIAMDVFIVFMIALLPFTVPGETAFTFAGFPASWEGFVRAAQIALIANAVVLALLALVGSMESVTLGHALFHLRVPENLVHLLLFTVRYIAVLNQEYLRLRNAMKARGFRPGNNRHTYVSFGYLIGMMLVRAMERSERVLQAMKCRGFNGKIPMIDRFRFVARDVGFAAVSGIALVSLIGLEYFDGAPH